jgi:hypothetical protein
VQAGGAVINQRVLGVLAVSRALGDHELKNLVTCKPHMLTTDLPSARLPPPSLSLPSPCGEHRVVRSSERTAVKSCDSQS